MATDELSTLDDGRPANGVRDKPPSPAGRPLLEGEKFCRRCGLIKNYAEFNRNRTTRDGLQSRCRDCGNAAVRDWRAKGSPPRDPNYDYPLRRRTSKRCPECGEEKPIEHFGQASADKYDGRQTYCKPCMAARARRWRKSHPRTAEQQERHREYSATWRERHRERLQEQFRERYHSDAAFRERHLRASSASTRKRLKARLDLLNALKEYYGCAVCDLSDSRCLDFHHRDPAQKRFTVTQQLSRRTEALLAEAAKCVVLCANCHRLIHAGKMQVPADAPYAVLPLT